MALLGKLLNVDSASHLPDSLSESGRVWIRGSNEYAPVELSQHADKAAMVDS